MGVLADLTLRLRANSAELSKGLDNAKKNLGGFKKNFGSTFKDLGNEMKKGLGGSISSLTGGLSDMLGSGVKAFSGLIEGVKGFAAAFAMTGIGAIIIAIVASMSALVMWMKRTDEGGDTMKKVFNGIKAVLEVVMDRVAILGGAIDKIFKGDWKGAVNDVKGAFTGLKGAVQANIDKANELTKIQIDAEKFNMTYAKKKAELEVEISELKLKSRDKEKYDEVQRLGFIEEEKNKLKELYSIEYQYLQYQIEEEKKKQALGYSSREDKKKLNELEAQQVLLKASYNDKLRETLQVTNSILKVVDRINEIEKEQANYTPLEKLKPLGGLLKTEINPELSKLQTYVKELYNMQNPKPIDYWKEFGKIMNSNQFILESFSNAIGDLSDQLVNLVETEKLSMKSLVTSTLDGMRQIINALLAKAIAGIIAGEATKGVWGLATAAIALPLLMGLWNSKVPEFATGGIVYGPTNALVGEYPNARNNPEVIAPLSKLEHILANANGMGGEVRFRIEGYDLIGILEKGNVRASAF